LINVQAEVREVTHGESGSTEHKAYEVTQHRNPQASPGGSFPGKAGQVRQ